MLLHGLCIGEEAGARNRAFFRVTWLQPAIKATSFVRRLRLGSFESFVLQQCLCLCASFYMFLDFVVPDRIGMAA